ncbi:hypothetical protein AAHC03_020821 [Spirometra sp. Aus1]
MQSAGISRSLFSRRKDGKYKECSVTDAEIFLKQTALPKFKTTSDVVFAFGFRTKFGGGKSSGFVNVYDSVDFAIKFEPKHRLLRNGLLAVTERKARVLRKKMKNEMKNIRGIAKLTGIPRQKKSKN